MVMELHCLLKKVALLSSTLFQHPMGVLPVVVGEWWSKLYIILLRPMLKWLLHRITGKCELLRISETEDDIVIRTKRTESSLRGSSFPELKNSAAASDFGINETVSKILKIKNIASENHEFREKLKDSLTRIRAYNKITEEAENLRQTKYSSENEEHEKCLKQLWALYNTETPLPSRIGAHWTDIGFQGHDPMTDFRGMGMLGLEQLIYFAATYPEEAKKVLSQSHHPQYGFSFSIVGINLTGMAHKLLVKRRLCPHFYRAEKQESDLQDFHRVYCHLLYEFTQFWISEKPKDIMEFSRVRQAFYKKIKRRLQETDANLSSPFQQK